MDVPVSEGDHVTNGNGDIVKGAPPPPSPLTGCYLLIVVGEPYSEEHKDIILQRIAKGLLSWDVENCHVDLEKELQAITDVGPEGEETRHGERLIQFATENLVTEVLIHPAANTLIQCMKNLLSSFTRHRHIIHSGYTFGGNGSWALQDGTFSLADFTEAFQENEVQRVIKAYENTITIDIHCSTEGDWTRLPKESFTKSCKVQVNPNDVLTSGSPSINSFVNYLSPFLLPVDIETLLESSDVVGNIRFSHPTLYVFPGGQGDAALFGINGFNMLVDGGYARKACFWDFTRHLDRLDAVLVTRLNNSNVCGVSSVLKRKTNTQVYPQIGHFFCNLQERKAISPDGDKDKDPLLINLLDEGQEIISNLRQLNLRPQLCYRDTEPINLYHKVGHGTLDMYVLSPAKDSKEVKEFLHKWNTNDQRLFASRKDPREFSFPLSNLVSICALLVWQPANPSDTITRLLFPGSTPQHKIFEGLDRLKHLEFMKHPICSAKSLTPSGSIMGLSKTKSIKAATVLDKILPSEHKQKILDNRPVKEKSPPINNKHENKMNGTVEENKISHTEKIIKSNSVESDKSEPKSETKKTEMNGKDVEIILEDKSAIKKKTESKPKQRVTKARSESSTRRSVEKKAKVEKKVETKASPPTPKKTVDSKVNGVAAKDAPRPKLLNRTGVKASPTSTPAKSTKDANNRKVIESKYKPAPKKEPIAKKEVVKTERKPISRRPKAASPTRSGKMPASPSKKLPGIKTDKNGISRTIKLDKEGTTDSSAVSTPSADQDISKKIDVSKLSKTELEELKAKELADLKEEQEVVKEIEAVFRKDDKLNESDQSDLRKIKDISLDEKTTEPEDEEEEYLIVEKEEVELNTDSVNEQESATKEDEIQKHQRDSEESEKPRKESDTDKNTGEKIEEEVPVEKEVQETKLIEADTCKVLEIISPQVKEEDNIVPTGEMTRSKEDSRDKTEEMSKEISSVTSPEDKIDVSSEKKLTDTRDVEEEENKEVQDQNVLESQPDEKFSATIESGATTAPTLPEDERIPLDEIKEDQVIEEKYVKEETKEKEVPAVVLPQKQFEPVPKISPIIGMKFDAHQSHIRDIVKTPDEVADLPVHEEVDIDTYDFPGYKKDVTKKGEVAEKPRDDVAKSSDKVEMKVKKESELADEVKPEKEDEIQAEVIDEADKKVPLEEDKTGITVTAIVEPTNESIKDTQQIVKDETVVKELETSEEKVVEDTKEKEEKTDIEKEKNDTEELLVDEEKPDEKEGEILTTIKDAIEEITATAKEDVKEILEKKESIKDVEATKEEIKTNLTDAKELDSEKKSIVSDEKNLEEAQTKIDTEEEDKNVTDDDKTKAVISEVDTKNVEDKQDDVEQENNLKKDAKVFRSEAEIVRIVSNVAHVLKSDAPLEELAPTLPIEYSPTFKPFALKGYTTELRETHITTLDSPVHEDVIIPTKETSQEIKEICPKQSTISFLNEERKLSGEKALEETVTKSDISPQEKKISDLIKDSNALIASTSKIISNIKSSTVAEKDDEIQSEKISEETIKTDDIIEEDQNLEQADQNLEQVDKKLKESDQNLEQIDQKLNESDQNLEQVDQKEDDENNGIGTVHRMLVTASSEDGGEETVICPTGSIKFIKDSSGRSTPDIAISPPKEDEETVNDEGEKSPIKKDSIVDTMSGKSSPKLTDDKIASGRTTPEIIIDLDETEIDENADANFVVDQSDQLKSADTTADPIIAVTENKTITDDSKLEEKLELVEESTKPTDMDLKESKQIVSDKTSPDIKDEISETSTKEDVETVKELSPVSTDKDKVLELKDDQSGKATQDQKIDATSSDDKEEKITDSLPETKNDTELKRDSISGPLSPGLKTDLNTIIDISGKSTPEPKQILSGKSTPDLKDKLESGKATPDMTKIESGKATPDLKEKRDSLQSETKDDSGKATPDITEKKDSLTETKEDSGKATPDLKEKSDSLQPETKQDSGKATPDLADKQDSLPDAKEDSGKATPDLEEKRDSLPIESKEESGKTTPDLKEKRDSIQSETKVESGKATPDLQEKQDSSKTESKEQSGKVTPDLQEKRDSLNPESKEHSGKATPDLQEKRDSLQAESKEHSGKTTPDLQEKRDSIQLETKQESGKATPDLQEKQDSLQSVTKQDSGKATPDLTDKRDSLIPDAKDASGKATPDLTDKRDSLIADVKDTSGKTSPDLKDKVESGKVTPNLEEKRDSLKPESKEQSGKTTPDFTDSLQPESKIESGKATPDLQEKRDSLKQESKEHSGKSTPDFTDSLQPETKVDSGKATPDLQEKHDSLKLESKDQSGKSTPEFTDSLQPETKVDSGKATPDLQEKRDSLKPESKEHSGKVTPDLQEKRDSIQLETKIESGKATPDLQEKRDSIQIDSKQESGKTTPDLQEKQDSLQPQTKQDSGKATPDLKEKRGSLIVEEKEDSGKSSPHLKEESGKSTPDIKEKTTDDKVVISGKSSPLPESSPKEDVIAKNERSESIISVTSVKSGKSSPDFKENERISTPDHHITDTKNTSGKSSPMPEIKSTDLTTDKSGKSTPDIKDASGKSTPDLKQEEIKSSKQSGKSTPDPQVNISEIKDISGKSTPDLKQEQISAVDLHEQSGKTTPDIKQDDIKSSLTNDISGKSTPDIKKDEVKSISGLSDKSGKSTPDLKNEDSQVHLPSDIQKVTDEFEKSTEIINEIVSSASTIEILSTSDIKVDISGKSSPSLIREEIKSRASITSVQSGKSTPELITEVLGDAKNISGKTTPDLKHEILTGTQTGKSTPDIKANEVKIETGQSTPDLKVNNISGSGKSTPDLKGENISARATPDLHEDLNLDRKSIVSITSEKSGTSTPDFKEDISARATPEIPDIKCERKSIVSSGKTTPDLKEDISARGTPDIHDITCDRKSIVSITSEKSGKSTPDIKEDISARATPDITCDSKSIISITSEKSGKSTPDLKEDISACATPDIHDITSDRKSIVSITTDKSGKSTPDLKEDISARATPDITCDRKSIVSITSEKSGKSTPDLKEDISAHATPEIQDAKSEHGKSTPDMKVEEILEIKCELTKSIGSGETLESLKTSDDKQESGKSTISILNGSGKSTPDIQITIGKSTDDSKKDDLLSEKDTSLTDVSKDSQPTVITTEVTELSVAGPSHIQRDDSIPSSGQISPLNKDLQHLSSEDLHLSGKSTPDIADVERMKEIHEILKHEKHIPGSSTPPTVPVSPIVKESFSLQSEEVKDKKELPLVQEKMDVPKETEVVEKQTSTLVVTKTKVEDLTISKDSETQKSDRCATPGSDDCDFGGVSSPHSDISSGQMSRVAHAWGHGSSEERQAYSDDDDVPGSPTSVTSQMAHSPPTHFTDVEFESGPESILHKTKKHDPMSASLYGALPDETTEHSVLKTSTQSIPITTASTTSSHIDISKTKDTEKRFLDEADLDFEKAMLEHRQTRGSDLIGSDKTESVNYKYEITTAKFTKPTLENGKDNGMQMKEIKNGFDTCESVSHSTKTDSPKKSSPEMMTSSFIEGSSSSSSQQSQEVKKDPIESWGKPLGLPSPALPPTSDMSNKTTPKKMPPSATLAAKNKINDERKRSDSPSKYDKKNKKMSPVYLDLTYVPHHGNSYYSFVEFFKRVRARYYVFSGTEPSKEVYNALLEAKQTWEDKELEVTIIPTYDTDVLGYWVAENEDLLAKHKIDLSPSASRCTINLQDHETSCSAYRLEF